MKANAPKRKVFQDALDLLAEDPVKDTPVAVNGIVSIPVEEACCCLWRNLRMMAGLFFCLRFQTFM